MFTVFRQHKLGDGFDSMSGAVAAVKAKRSSDRNACQYSIVGPQSLGTLDFEVHRKYADSSQTLDYREALDHIKRRRCGDSSWCIYTIEFSE